MKKVLFILTLFAAQLSQAQWEPDVRLTNNSGISWTSFNNAWCVAASEDTVHVVWEDNRDGRFEVYYKRSTDGGTSWEADTRLTYLTNLSQEPSIVVSGNDVHVFWFYEETSDNYEIYYKRSEDGGNTWGSDTRLSYFPSYSYELSAAISGSVLHVVWMDGRFGNDEIFYMHSLDGGLTWGPDISLTNNSAYSGYPCVSAYDSVVHVVYEDNRDGNVEIYYRKSIDGGVGWGAETRLTNASGDSWAPCLAVSDSSVHVTWYDDRDGQDQIYYKSSMDGGITWVADKKLTNSSGASYPSIAVNNNDVHIVWFDNRMGNDEIYYKNSANGGFTWGLNDTRLTNSDGNSQFPSIGIIDSVVHVVWNDFRDGNYEIYYKRKLITAPLTTDFIANPTVICSGDSTQFTDLTSMNPTQWQWTFVGGTPDTSSQQNPQISYNTPGSYNVTLFASNGTSSNLITKTDYITVIPSTLATPEIPTGPDYINLYISTETEYYTTGSPESEFYEWSLVPSDAGIVSILDTTTALVIWNLSFSGEAGLTVMGTNDCGSSDWSDTLAITVDYMVGLDNSDNKISSSIYPNPNNGVFTVNLQSVKDQNFTIKVLNILGQTVYKRTFVHLSGIYSDPIQLTSVSNGIFFLQIESESTIYKQKIIIQGK